MKSLSYTRIYQSQKCLSALGEINYRPQFGGYSLSVENVVFAMVVDGELYLRACAKSETYFFERASPRLITYKRGRRVILHYYQVDEELWQNTKKLIQLSSCALLCARHEKFLQKQQKRLKDLPNLSVNLETLLCRAGITDLPTLQAVGARRTWIKLRAIKRCVGLQVLLALAGAISGIHQAVLPTAMRQELYDWYNQYSHR